MDRERLNRQKFRPPPSQVLPLLFVIVPGFAPITPVVVFERRLEYGFSGAVFENCDGGHRTGRPPHTTMKGIAIYIPWVEPDRESLKRQKFRPSLSQILPLLFLNIPGSVPIRPVVVFERRLGYTSRPRTSRGYQRLNLRTLST